MDLNLFKNLKENIESNVDVKNFMDELSNFLNNLASSNTHTIQKDFGTDINEVSQKNETSLTEKDLEKNRKEGHLYLVTEDRNNEVYLWDFTDKPKHEFVEKDFPEELLRVATEGAMLQYKNGAYELYSPDGYDMLYNETNNENTEK